MWLCSRRIYPPVYIELFKVALALREVYWLLNVVWRSWILWGQVSLSLKSSQVATERPNQMTKDRRHVEPWIDLIICSRWARGPLEGQGCTLKGKLKEVQGDGVLTKSLWPRPCIGVSAWVTGFCLCSKNEAVFFVRLSVCASTLANTQAWWR